MYIGIVGHEAKKFTPATKQIALDIIRKLLKEGDTLVSGGCHLGGIDIWAEEIADEMGLGKMIFLPKKRSWSGGYKERNLRIAEICDILHNIVVEKYPEGYEGMRFKYCYHCDTVTHIKSGGCWTAKNTKRLGKQAFNHVIREIRL
jgi:hypothetical protein